MHERSARAAMKTITGPPDRPLAGVREQIEKIPADQATRKYETRPIGGPRRP